MTAKKYEFTGETKAVGDVTLKRIRLLIDLPRYGLKAGDLGGWIEKEENLSHNGNARVYGNAQVYGDAQVSRTNITAVRSDNYTFSVCATPDGPRIIAGCRYFSYEEAVNHWTNTRGGTQLGEESLLIVNHLKAMAGLNGLDKKAGVE